MEEDPDHLLDLRFAGVAVTRHGLFDLAGGVLRDIEALLGQGEKGHAPSLAQPESALHVPGEEDRLHGGAIRPVCGHDGAKLTVDAKETLSERSARLGGNGPEGNRLEIGSPIFHQAVSRGDAARVDA